MNSCTHGVWAHSALMPGETLDMYAACVESWQETLRPEAAGLVQLMRQIADAAFRSERLARHEQRLLEEALEGKVWASEANQKLTVARDALAAVRGLAVLAEGVTNGMSAERVQVLLPAMRRVVDLTAATEVPGALLGPLGAAVEGFVLDSLIEVTSGSFASVAVACRAVETDLVSRTPRLELELEDERERIARNLLLADSKELRLLDHHRSRLAKELALHMDTYKKAQELAVQAPARTSGVPLEPCRVELRVVERSAR